MQLYQVRGQVRLRPPRPCPEPSDLWALVQGIAAGVVLSVPLILYRLWVLGW